MTDTLAQLADLAVVWIRRFKYRFNNERELQEQLASGPFLGQDFRREYVLDQDNRVDFYFPRPDGIGLGVEVKVAGTPANVLRQVWSYAGFGEIGELILVTSRMRLGGLCPAEVNGKRLQIVNLWESGL
jgi:hypothetical protein